MSSPYLKGARALPVIAAASVSALRGVDDSYLQSGSQARVDGHTPYTWNPTETTADDGDDYVKPDSVSGAGRWVGHSVLVRNSVGQATSHGTWLINKTVAASGTGQNSPGYRMTAGYTEGGGTEHVVDWVMHAKSSGATHVLAFTFKEDNGSWSTKATLDSTGKLTVNELVVNSFEIGDDLNVVNVNGKTAALNIGTDLTDTPQLNIGVDGQPVFAGGSWTFTGTIEVVTPGTSFTVFSETVQTAETVLHLNHSTGNVPIPVVACGIAIHRGNDGSADRDHAGFYWMESASYWLAAFDTEGDDSPVLADGIPIRAKGFYSTASTIPSTGFIRVGNNEAIVWRGTAADHSILILDGSDDLLVGSSAVNSAEVEASNDVLLTSRNTDVILTAPGTAYIKNASANRVSFTDSAVNMYIQGITWDAGVAVFPTISQGQAASDVATQSIIVAPQRPYNTATGTNRTPGHFALDFAAPTNSGTTEGAFYIRNGGSDTMRFQKQASYLTEMRVYTGQFYIRPNDLGSGIVELHGAAVYVSGNFAQRDISQVHRARWNLASTGYQLEVDASVTTLLFSQFKRTGNGANAGTDWKLRAQDGQNVAAGTNNDGGDFIVSSGGKGTGGSDGLDGSVRLQVNDSDVLTVSSNEVLADTDMMARRFGTTPDSPELPVDPADPVELDLAKCTNFEFKNFTSTNGPQNIKFTVANKRAGTTFRVKVDQPSSGDPYTVEWPLNFAFPTGTAQAGDAGEEETIWNFYIDTDLKVTCEGYTRVVPP